MIVYMSAKVKICGITNMKDALLAAEYGADFLGFIFTKSKRQIQPEKARKIIKRVKNVVTTVGVFMDDSLEFIKKVIQEAEIDIVQLHGKETPEFCQKIEKRVIKRIHVNNYDTHQTLIRKMRDFSVFSFLLDPGTGSGKTFDWTIASNINLPLIIAGGLNPNNVKEMIQLLHPFGVDVSSGVEKKIGKKDPEKIRRFIEEVK